MLLIMRPFLAHHTVVAITLVINLFRTSSPIAMSHPFFMDLNLTKLYGMRVVCKDDDFFFEFKICVVKMKSVSI